MYSLVVANTYIFKFYELECGFTVANFIKYFHVTCVSCFTVRRGKFAVYATFCVKTKCVDAKLVVKMNRP